MSLLNRINSPEDIKSLSITELEHLATEVRQQLIETVNRNGGHLASPLGVVDLTIALHYVYDVGEGKDQLIWDVGHQCYANKLLPGRRDVFDTIRKKDGISGYPKISESEYDCFGTGHSSLAMLRRLPIDVLKIDRSFVDGLPDDDEDRAIVRAIIGLGRTLNMDVTAEGVELPGQALALIEEGCQRAQGYLYSPPAPRDEVPELLAALGEGCAPLVEPLP